MAMKKKILLVDDVRLFLKLEETFFRRTGCEIVMAESGSKALDLALSQGPSLILLDYIMPDIMGDEVCRRLKADDRTRDIPIIIVSTSADPGDMQKCFNAGADEYVTKPINPQEILAKAAAMLNIPHRVHCRTPVSFRVQGAAAGASFTGFTRNISRGGLLLECGVSISPDTTLTLDLPILQEHQPLTLNARVVRLEADPIKGANYIGVQFDDLTAFQKVSLEDFIKRSTELHGCI
jgi:CheY-like chemotaxis protein